MRSLLTRGLAALVATAAIAAVAPPAGAETVVVRDARGDVQRIERDESLSPAPRERTSDIRRLAVRHGYERIGIALTLGRTVSAGDRVLEAQLALPGRARATVVGFGQGRRWQALAFVDGVDRADDSRQCKASIATRPARDRVVVTVPRRCLGRPDWVRANVRLITITDPGSAEVAFVDTVHRSAGLDETRARFGPKVRVG